MRSGHAASGAGQNALLSQLHLDRMARSQPQLMRFEVGDDSGAFVELLVRHGASLGSCVWPGALALCSEIMLHSAEGWASNATVLELGAGVGLVGLCAAKFCACSAVVCTDTGADTMALLDANVKGATSSVPITSQDLDWTMDFSLNTVEKFEVILAADVIYDASLHAPLLSTLDAVTREESVVQISFQIRSSSDSLFFLAASRTWIISVISEFEYRPGEMNAISRVACQAAKPFDFHSALAAKQLDLTKRRIYILLFKKKM